LFLLVSGQLDLWPVVILHHLEVTLGQPKVVHQLWDLTMNHPQMMRLQPQFRLVTLLVSLDQFHDRWAFNPIKIYIRCSRKWKIYKWFCSAFLYLWCHGDFSRLAMEHFLLHPSTCLCKARLWHKPTLDTLDEDFYMYDQ
jgi:hypothetical protein